MLGVGEEYINIWSILEKDIFVKIHKITDNDQKKNIFTELLFWFSHLRLNVNPHLKLSLQFQDLHISLLQMKKRKEKEDRKKTSKSCRIDCQFLIQVEENLIIESTNIAPQVDYCNVEVPWPHHHPWVLWFVGTNPITHHHILESCRECFLLHSKAMLTQ